MTTLKILVSINGSTIAYYLPPGVSTAPQLAASKQFQDDFSLGSNITVLVNGYESGSAIRPGDFIAARELVA